jgi:hypothetical protein
MAEKDNSDKGNGKDVRVDTLIGEEIEGLADVMLLTANSAFRNHVSQRLFEVAVTICGKPVHAMLDTGATGNLLSEAAAAVMPDCMMDKDPDCLIRLANGEAVRPSAKLFAPLAIDGQIVDLKASFLVLKNLPFDAIIGIRFLKENFATMVFGPERNRLVIRDRVYHSLTAAEEKVLKLPAFVATNQKLKGRKETNVRVIAPGAESGSLYVLSGLPSLAADGLHTGTTTSEAQDGCFLLRIRNVRNSTFVLRSNRQVGFVSPC